MASVDFEKLKTKQEVKALLKHCDREERKATQEHSNKQIDKSKTGKNLQIKRSYKETCKRFDDRLKYLDSLENANTRKDRVLCFGLEIPCPADITGKSQADWVNKVLDIVKRQYGADNLMNAYFHRDEAHEYIDCSTGKQRTSLDHLHLFVVPEINNRLNGKQFSSRANMKKLNTSIHKMTMQEFGVDFLTGEQTKSKDSVETLKNKSSQIALQKQIEEQDTREDALDLKEKKLNRLEAGLLERESELNIREGKLNARESDLQAREEALEKNTEEYTIHNKNLFKKRKSLEEKEKNLNALEDKLQEIALRQEEERKALLNDQTLQSKHREALQKRNALIALRDKEDREQLERLNSLGYERF